MPNPSTIAMVEERALVGARDFVSHRTLSDLVFLERYLNTEYNKAGEAERCAEIGDWLRAVRHAKRVVELVLACG